MKSQKFFLLVFLLCWYYLSFQVFFHKDYLVEDTPELRARFGTIMWHSSDRNGRTGEAVADPGAVTHIYCYYPKGSTQYPGKSGEYIIKREDSGDCTGWYGQAIFYEGSWVSEREKIWWSKNQKLQEDLVNLQQKPTTI